MNDDPIDGSDPSAGGIFSEYLAFLKAHKKLWLIWLLVLAGVTTFVLVSNTDDVPFLYPLQH